MKQHLTYAVSAALLLLCSQQSFAGAYVFSNGNANVDTITHPTTYTGTGGPITVTFCVDPNSESPVSYTHLTLPTIYSV